MPDDLSIGERIGELAATQKINLKELSRKADVPYTTLYAMVNRKSNRVQKSTLYRVARALGVTVDTLTGTDSTYLSDSDSKTFITRFMHYFSGLNADLNSLQSMGLYTYLRPNDEKYRPTKDDVAHFSEDTGLSIAYLLGMEDETSEVNKTKLQIDGFTDIEIALCERHIRRFVADDLKQVLCSSEEAEAIAILVLKHIGAENLVSLARTANIVSPGYLKAALSVLDAGVEATLKEEAAKKGLRVERSHYAFCESEFDVWATAKEDEFVRSEFTIGTDLNPTDAFAVINAYFEEKPPRDQTDSETE